MDWTVYWFMLPACIVIAGTATFSGISGAALMTPMFLLAFPLLHVPLMTTVQAIGAALFLETAGFGAGVYHYLRMRLVDTPSARSLIAVTGPSAIVGALLAHQAPATLLRIVYGVAMLGVAWMLGRGSDTPARRPQVACPCIVCESECSSKDEHCPPGRQRHLEAADGKDYDWCAHFEKGQRIVSGIGAFLAGLISTGVGEATLPALVRKGRVPVPVAAATSTFVVAGTVVAASLAHGVLLGLQGSDSMELDRVGRSRSDHRRCDRNPLARTAERAGDPLLFRCAFQHDRYRVPSRVYRVCWPVRIKRPRYGSRRERGRPLGAIVARKETAIDALLPAPDPIAFTGQRSP